MKIGKEIALEVRKCNIEICDEYYKNMMSFSNYAQLASMYFKGSDWSMENDFPRIDILRKHKGCLLPYGMVTDVSEAYSNTRYLAVFGESEVNLIYKDYSVGQVIIRHESKASVKAYGNSKVFINVLDNAQVVIDCEDEASVTVYDYGKNTKIKTQGNVKIILSKWEK